MTYTAHSRKTVRDAFVALLAAKLVGTGLPAQAVYGYLPSNTQGQWPILVVRSAGSRRRPGMRSHADFHDEFRLEVLILVHDADTSINWTDANVEDKLDQLEAALAEVVADNRITNDWFFLDFEDSFSRVFMLALGGEAYVAEQINVIVTCF